MTGNNFRSNTQHIYIYTIKLKIITDNPYVISDMFKWKAHRQYVPSFIGIYKLGIVYTSRLVLRGDS